LTGGDRDVVAHLPGLIADAPRDDVGDLRGVERFRERMMTYTSGDTSGRPSAPAATCGSAAMMLDTSRPRPLESSESAPLRSTRTFRLDPVLASAALKPLASASMPMNTATTRPTPSAVSAVETGRCTTLRTL